MRVKLNAWPEGTPDFVSHSVMRDYIQDTSQKTGVHGSTIYGARVKNISKQGGSWEVTWSRLEQDDDGVKEQEQIWVGVYAYTCFILWLTMLDIRCCCCCLWTLPYASSAGYSGSRRSKSALAGAYFPFEAI